MTSHPPYYPSPSPARSLPSCAKHATPVQYPSSDHCSLITAHWTYSFSAKERDSETGLSYFGSRYYSSDLSIWLSVDPMSDKYASLSPYVYCADNPIKLVDPNGDSIINGYSNALIFALEELHQAEALYNRLLKNDEHYSLAKEVYEKKYAQYYLIKKNYDQVQKIITDFQTHSPEMYDKLNHLCSPSGLVDVYVFVNHNLGGGTLTGQSEINHSLFVFPHSKLDVHFFTLIDCKNRIISTNGVRLIINPKFSDQIGNSFAHEGGHIYYEVTDPVGYANWLEKNGSQSAVSGHLKGKNGEELNPSGKMANEWERNY